MIRLLLVDDQPLVLAGLRMVFEPEPDVEIVGEAEDGSQAIRLAAELRPAVVLMDIRMPGLDGIQATERILMRARRPVDGQDPRWTCPVQAGAARPSAGRRAGL